MIEDDRLDGAQIWKELGLPTGGQLREGSGPRSVDRDLIRAYHLNELSDKETEEIRGMLVAFQDWSDANQEIICETETVSPNKAKGENDFDSANSLQAVIPEVKLGNQNRRLGHRVLLVTTILIAAVIAVVIWPRGEKKSQWIARLEDKSGLVTLDQHGNLVGLDALPEKWQTAVKEMLESQNVNIKPENRDILTTMRSGPNDSSSSLISPLSTAIRTTQPSFRWKPLKGATSYTVVIYSAQLEKPIKSDPLTGTEWQTLGSLQRGVVYSWEVQAVVEGEAVVTPRRDQVRPKFKILTQVDVEKIDQEARKIEASRLALTVLYAQAGLLEDAESEIERLAEANPESEIVIKILENLKRRRFEASGDQ